MFSTAYNFSQDHEFFDDFWVGPLGESGLSAASSGGSIGNVDPADADHPGIAVARYAGASTDRAAIRMSVNSIQGGGGDMMMQYVMNIATLSNVTDEYVFSLGLFDTTTTDAVDGVYFEYDRATAGDFWRSVTSNNSTRTKNTSSNAIVAGTWVTLRIELNAAWTRAKFFFNGALFDTITTNIPIGTARTTGHFWGFRKSAGTGTASVAQLDSILIKHTQTTPIWTN